MNCATIFLVTVLLLPLAALSQEVKATLLEGKVTIIRGTALLQGVEGMWMRPGDIVENSGSGLAQIECGGTAIAVVGPATRLLLSKISGTGADLFLLSGWLKTETNAKESAFRYSTLLLGAAAKNSTFVLHAAPGTSEIFVESGSGNLAEVSPAGTWTRTPMPASSGQFISRKTGKNAARADRPDSAFLGAMPIPFRDTFPSRWSRFQGGKPPEPKRDREVSYADVQSWLTIPPAWRRGFVERFQPRLKDPAFRQAIEDHLSELPEWDRALHPEKYQTNPPPASSGGSTKQGRY
jgi:hypothetical protein